MITDRAWRLLVFSVWIAAIVAAAFVLFVRYARAHDDAQWIQDGGFKNAIGELCCGKRDCVEINSRDVQETPQGFYIISINELVPHSEATPSPDGHYWRCAWGGKRKCFFAPPGSS